MTRALVIALVSGAWTWIGYEMGIVVVSVGGVIGTAMGSSLVASLIEQMIAGVGDEEG